ncbi:MAG: sulfotransferase, partial [Woeseiaceae bacterium]
MNRKEELAVALLKLRSGNFPEAVRLCDQSLTKFPGDATFLCLAGQASIALKKFDIAEEYIDEAIRVSPDFATAFETHGDLMLVKGHPDKARASYQTATHLDPTRDLTRQKLDRTKQLEERGLAARASSDAAKTRYFEDEIRRAIDFEANNDRHSAEMIYRDILTREPNHVEAARLLAGVATHNRRFRDAEVFLKRVLDIAPDHARAWLDLANVQREMDKFDDAVECARQVLRLAPDNAESHMAYAVAIGMTGAHEEAIEAYQRAIDMAPEKAGAICAMAHHQKTIGHQGDAIASYRRAIAVKPDHAEAYWSLANLKTFRFDDDEVAAIQELLRDESLPDVSRAQLHNALGLELEARKDYSSAFRNFEQCNAIRRLSESYDPVETQTTYDRIIELFDSEFIAKNAGVPAPDVTPILVVGLPRSGSTLIEQILASHSQVDGTHELGDLARAVQSVIRENSRRSRFPETLAKLNRENWQSIGQEYLRRTELFRSGAPYFIDKNPNNFIYAGVVKLALPNARIINARRHPLDSCFGSFKQLFASGQPFTYDMTELGEYYLQYQRLMDHWHAVLPGFVLDANYE